MICGMSDAAVENRRDIKDELVRGLAEVAMLCKNGGRTLRLGETQIVTDYIGGLAARALEDAAFRSVLSSAKGCKTAPSGLVTQGVRNLLGFVNGIATGGCGETFAVDAGTWARHIVTCNPGNAGLRELWRFQGYDERLLQARRDGENELAVYLRAPAQRTPESLEEALGFLAYWSGDETVDEEAWEGLRETVGDSFAEQAERDGHRATMLREWQAALPKFTYQRALKMCVEKYASKRALAQTRLDAIRPAVKTVGRAQAWR